MMSVKEISENLKLSKIMVYRFINDNEIKHSGKDGRTFLYDNKAFEQIYDGLKDKTIISTENKNENTENSNKEKINHTNEKDIIIEILKSELEIKNSQIESLTEMNKSLNITIQQQQTLLLNEQQRDHNLLETVTTNKKWWQFWKA